MRTLTTCSHCHAANDESTKVCRACGRDAQTPRALCSCRRCARTMQAPAPREQRMMDPL